MGYARSTGHTTAISTEIVPFLAVSAQVRTPCLQALQTMYNRGQAVDAFSVISHISCLAGTADAATGASEAIDYIIGAQGASSRAIYEVAAAAGPAIGGVDAPVAVVDVTLALGAVVGQVVGVGNRVLCEGDQVEPQSAGEAGCDVGAGRAEGDVGRTGRTTAAGVQEVAGETDEAAPI